MPPVEALSRIRRGQLAFNHFEDVVYRSHPRLSQLRDTLSGEPFVCVLMSGSGSTIYGLAPTMEEAERIAASLRSRLEADVFVATSELPSAARQETEERKPAGGSVSAP
jgi:4-diphosphocytidyl-2C-methyl-D-erythritol kinase